MRQRLLADFLPRYTGRVNHSAPIALPADDACECARHVVAVLRQAGHSAYWVGGCVRDLLLGRRPKDYDVATSARPKQVQGLFEHVVLVGVAFGVVRVRVQGRSGAWVEIEVATFRADGAYLDGRRPQSVRFCDAEQDVLRRDFTINGLLLDPLDAAGAVAVDWVGGLPDLRDGLIRAIGEPQQRFGEDALRLLRAPRFAARFGFAVEPATAAAIRQLAATLDRVSVERISGELMLMLTAADPARGLRSLAELGLAAVLWPALTATDPDLRAAQDRLTAAKDAVAAGPAHAQLPHCRAFHGQLAVALLAVGRQNWLAAPEFARSFCLPKADLRAIAAIVRLAGACPLPSEPVAPPWPAGWARWLREPLADEALVAAQVTGRAGMAAWRQARALWPRADAFPDLGFDGTDLQRWGYAAGPSFRDALAAAEDCRLAGGSAADGQAAARAVLDANRN